MPFTLSHTVLAPMLHYASQRRLPIAALAIGCMVPDLNRLFTNSDFNFSHQWPSLFSINLAVGLVFCLLWYSLYRPVLYVFLKLNDPISLPSPRAYLHFILLSIISIILGAASHIIWDGLTHADFRTVLFKEALQQPYFIFARPYPLHFILQIASSILALPIIAWQCYRYVRLYYQPEYFVEQTFGYALQLTIYALLAGILYASVFLMSCSHEQFTHHLYWVAGVSINHFFRASLVVWSLGCLVFLKKKKLYQTQQIE